MRFLRGFSMARGGGCHQAEMFGARGTNPRAEAEDSGPLGGGKGSGKGAWTLGWEGVRGPPALEPHFSAHTVPPGLCLVHAQQPWQ